MNALVYVLHRPEPRHKKLYSKVGTYSTFIFGTIWHFHQNISHPIPTNYKCGVEDCSFEIKFLRVGSKITAADEMVF